MKTILLIDDDLHIGNVIEEMLQKEGYQVLRAFSGTEALLVLKTAIPDLILLDLMLPGLCGEEVLARIKAIPVIILSAKVDVEHKADLLLEGAVDYITKPFHRKELLARIAVQLRVPRQITNTGKLQFQDVVLDCDMHQVIIEETIIKLTRTEYAILKRLMEHPKQVITKSSLLEQICEDTPDCTEASLKMHVSNLRKKLRSVKQKDYIEAVWGIGFKLIQ